MNDTAIVLKDLSFKYPGDTTAPLVIDGLDLEIRYGEILLVCGYSGSGKSTLLKLINGVIPFVQKGTFTGSIAFEGQDMAALSVSERSRFIGSVFQNPREQIVFDKLIDELVFPMENLCVPRELMKERSQKLLDELDLDPEARTATLSGGEKQKLMTAATLSMQQKVLLLDEPLANLDHKSAVELLDLLHRLAREENYAIVLVEHRLDLVRRTVDRVLSFTDGHRFFDSPEDFFSGLEKDPPRRPANDFLRQAPSQDAATLITLNGVGCTIEGKEIFSDVDLKVRAGEHLVILGDNGRGKTTLLEMIAGLRAPTKGTIRHAYPPRALGRKVGMVLQNPDYQLFMLTVKDELELTSVDPAWTDFLIRHFAFAPLLSRSPFSLSEGQKRKLGFACILARKPEVLLLDEPTVGLDDTGLFQLLTALDQYGQDNPLTLITVSHDRRAIPLLGERQFYL